MPSFPGDRSCYDLTYSYADGRPCVRIGHATAALPCPGVALRFSAVIDCRPGELRMPPVTIDFVKDPLLPASGCGDDDGPGPRPAAQVSGRFTCDSGDLALPGQFRRVEEMVAAAGLPPECAPSVAEFLRLSASSASDMFFRAVAVTVEAAAPGSFAVKEFEDEAVPPGAASADCAICYMVYVVGGDTSVELPCGHGYHRKCIEYWTSLNPTCPYCRAPVPEPGDHGYWDEEEDRSTVPRGDSDTARNLDVSGSQPSWTWGRVCVCLIMLVCVVSLCAKIYYG